MVATLSNNCHNWGSQVYVGYVSLSVSEAATDQDTHAYAHYSHGTHTYNVCTQANMNLCILLNVTYIITQTNMYVSKLLYTHNNIYKGIKHIPITVSPIVHVIGLRILDQSLDHQMP